MRKKHTFPPPPPSLRPSVRTTVPPSGRQSLIPTVRPSVRPSIRPFVRLSVSAHLSKDFFLLVKAIGESKSKQEEDRIIHSEVAQLKVMMGDRNLNKKTMKEFLIRLVYAEMLGHDASFGYIRAIELTASSSPVHKRTGYLCASLVLSPQHEFRFMLVNQLQRDMDNSHVLVIIAALTALCKLVTAEMIPAVLQHVVKLMEHDQPIVRKKAVMALMRFWQLIPESVADEVRYLAPYQIIDQCPR